jgi:hypothetical protein
MRGTEREMLPGYRTGCYPPPNKKNAGEDFE